MEYSPWKKLVRSKSGLRIVLANDDCRSPFLLCEPPWTPDSESKNCTDCKSKFGLTLRRHHCRRCGRIYCGHCCSTRLPLPRMSFVDPVRMCEQCADQTSHEQDFFQRHLKVLTNGASFVSDSSLNGTDLMLCKLTPDHRYLMFDGTSQDPIDILLIKSFSVSKDVDVLGGSSMQLVFTTQEDSEKHLKLTTGPDALRKMGSSWILAMQQALKFLYNMENS
ncbi:zinc finger FYVE domain-containing protein 21-like isoform X2 [Thrips palmi]|uniref:Zinc finger FYVE domain-containing protein 21-like isoform X2 n=1 Tax=Thrips palmi TaxID=161013 RepID=A0A6P8Y6S5_THRPL|nr:zinc finger FYVE domain-containing protein 21-like isoform X2 [Thrips palmi]